VTFTATGTTYTPAAGFSGSDSYQYTIEDPAHHAASAWVHVTVGNAAPAFTSAADNSSQSLSPGATPRAVAAVDPNLADTVTYTATGTLPVGVALAPGGTFSGTVKLAGTFTLTVTATDNHGATAMHTLVIVVAQVGPVAGDDTDATAYLTAKAIDVLANDTDANGDPRTVSAVGGAAHGTVTFTATGVTYTPAAGFSGTDTFDYTVSDGAGSDVGTVTVTVANAQPAFTAATTNDVQDVAPGSTPLPVAASDPNTTDVLTYDVASGTLPAGMTLGSGGSFSGKAKAAGDYAVTIEVLDGNGGRDTTDLLLRVPNVAPTAVADGALTGTATSVTTSVLTNDSDANGDPITVTGLTNGSHGAVTFTPTTTTYTPNATYAGSDSYTYTISDGRLTATATVVISVSNAAPVFTGSADNTAQHVAPGSTPASLVATDANNDPLTYSLTSGALPLGVSVGNDGSFTGTVARAGTYRATFSVDDGRGGTAATALVITVDNLAPTAVDDTATTTYTSAVTTSVLANDSDANGDPLTVVGLGVPSHGTVSLSNGQPTYTPFAGYSGPDSYTYVVSDGALSARGTVTVSVTLPELPPIAADDSASTAYLTPVDVDVLANDTDPNGTLPTVVGVTQPAHGTAAFTATGTRYVPAAGFSGTDTYTYTISDGTLTGLDTGTVTVTVGNASPAFTADVTNDQQDVEPGATPVNVVAVDPNAADLLTYTRTGGALPAGMLLTSTGGFTGTALVAGDFTVTITVRDGNGGSDSTVLTLHVADRAPIVVDDSATTASGAAVTTDVLANDRDPNGKPLLLSTATDGAHGTVVTGPTGTTYTPAAGYAGTDTYTYTASDGTLTSVGTVRVSISNAPPAFDPATTTNAAQTVLPGAVPVPLVAGDPNSDPLTFAAAPGSLPPGITLNPDGTFGGAAAGRGTYPVTVTVTDGSATDSIILTITVPNLPPALTASA
ncbi:MAG: thrombospondin, partial [Gemmatimonadetes bacterium]|nr:thrombospondin [Gemmatimonadota bacterium]